MTKMWMNLSTKPWPVIAICSLCSLIDGFDLFAIGYVLPHLDESFATSATKGYLVSAGLLGMAMGALFLAPYADRFGRRRMLLVGLVPNFLGMLISALAPDATTLIVGRLVTGVGLGVVGVLIMVIGQEFAPRGRKNVAIGVIILGFPIGGMLAGVVGVATPTVFSGAWQGILWVGAGLTLAAFLLAFVLLPESPAFDRTSLQRQNTDDHGHRSEFKVASGQSLLTAENVVSERVESNILSRDMRSRTLMLWFIFVGLIAAFYFVTAWTPQLVTTAKGDVQAGSLVGMILSAGGVVGSILFSLIGVRVNAFRLSWISLLAAGLFVLGFAMLLESYAAEIMAALLGVAINIATPAMIAVCTLSYPTHLRATGYGVMYGVGRVGGIATPIAAGYAIVYFSQRALYLWTSVPLILGSVVAFRLMQSNIRRSRDFDIVEANSATAE